MIGDFHAKSRNWSYNDTTAEGAQLDYLTSLYGLKQVITESTHIWNSSSGCIDFIFSNQTNVITDSGVDRALDSNSKFMSKIKYPPYARKILVCRRSETDLINCYSIEIIQKCLLKSRAA